jgi:hypothetical protein
MCTFLVLAMGIALVSMSTNELKATKEQGDTVGLRNIAEAGVDRSFKALADNPMWRATDTTDANFNNAPITATVGGATQTLGTFTVDPIQDQGGDYVLVTAHAYYPNATTAGRLTKTVRVTAYKKWGTPFSAAAFGKSGVPLANGETDSYNSESGTYGGSNVGNKGDIRTDSTDPDSITIKSNGEANGKVIFGPGTDLSKVDLSKSRINDGDSDESNDILVAPNTAVMPDVTVPAAATELKTVSPFSSDNLTGGTLAAGTYWCNSINITGNSQLVLTGKVTIYVKGSISIGGNGIVNNGVPSDLQIYGTPACTSVDISGNGQLSAAVYAPQADIVLNGSGTNGQVFGALAGKTVSFNGNGTVLHYDEALQKVKGVVVGFRTKTWQEG